MEHKTSDGYIPDLVSLLVPDELEETPRGSHSDCNPTSGHKFVPALELELCYITFASEKSGWFTR